MFQTSNEPPSAIEYCDLRTICGLGKRTTEAAAFALQRSLFAISLRNSEGQLIGMGRVVGDLGCHVQIVDIAVHPKFQRRGLSKKIMEPIMDYIKTSVPDCAYVNLFADVDYVYQKYGFDYPKSKGMYLNRDRIQK